PHQPNRQRIACEQVGVSRNSFDYLNKKHFSGTRLVETESQYTLFYLSDMSSAILELFVHIRICPKIILQFLQVPSSNDWAETGMLPRINCCIVEPQRITSFHFIACTSFNCMHFIAIGVCAKSATMQ